MSNSNIVMTRVDARLIHGQVAVRWTKVLLAKKIVVVDDKSAADDFLTELLLLAAPNGVEVKVWDEKTALEEWEKGYGNENTIIIFQNIKTAMRCFEQGLKIESINIGQVPKNPQRTYHANNTCHLDEEEMQALIKMEAENVDVYFQPTPEDKRVEFEAVRKKFNK